MLGRELAAACAEAERHLGDRDNGRTVRRYDRVADNGINIHHFLDFGHGFGHQIADRMMFTHNFRLPFIRFN